MGLNEGQSEPAGSKLLSYKSLEPLRGEASESVPQLQTYIVKKTILIFMIPFSYFTTYLLDKYS